MCSFPHCDSLKAFADSQPTRRAKSRVRPDSCLAGCRKHHNYGASRAQDGDSPCFSRIERSEAHQRPPGGTRRRGSAIRSNDLSTGFLSSTASDVAFDQDEPLSFEDFEKALRLNAPGEDGAGDSAAGIGINWRLLVGDVLAQPVFFGVFYLLATPAIRESRTPLVRRGVPLNAGRCDRFLVIDREASDITGALRYSFENASS